MTLVVPSKPYLLPHNPIKRSIRTILCTPYILLESQIWDSAITEATPPEIKADLMLMALSAYARINNSGYLESRSDHVGDWVQEKESKNKVPSGEQANG
jgi:hypothetical protein